MVLEVSGGRLVLGILEAADAFEWALAFRSCTLEEVNLSTVVILNEDIGFKEAV
jgi:hypothetical protein